MFKVLTVLNKSRYLIAFLIIEAICFKMLLNFKEFQESVFLEKVMGITGSINNYCNESLEYLSLKEKNKKLLEENKNLRNLLKNTYADQSAYTDKTQADTTKDSTQTKLIRQYFFLESKVIHNTTNLSNNFFQIQRGFNQGIRKDMGVISDEGVAGIVVSTSDNFANVLSVLNMNTKISAKIKGTETITYVRWDGKNTQEMVIDNYPLNVKINIGDTIITSQYSDKFIENTSIGTIITYAINNNNNTYSIKLKLMVDFNKLNNVYVLENKFEPEIRALKKAYLRLYNEK